MDFGRQVGVEKRAKSEQKSIKKRIEKMMKKMSVLEAPGGEGSLRALWRAVDPGTPFYSKIKRTENREQRTENT